VPHTASNMLFIQRRRGPRSVDWVSRPRASTPAWLRDLRDSRTAKIPTPLQTIPKPAVSRHSDSCTTRRHPPSDQNAHGCDAGPWSMPLVSPLAAQSAVWARHAWPVVPLPPEQSSSCTRTPFRAYRSLHTRHEGATQRKVISYLSSR
jgi:hypothetical protein